MSVDQVLSDIFTVLNLSRNSGEFARKRSPSIALSISFPTLSLAPVCEDLSYRFLFTSKNDRRSKSTISPMNTWQVTNDSMEIDSPIH